MRQRYEKSTTNNECSHGREKFKQKTTRENHNFFRKILLIRSFIKILSLHNLLEMLISLYTLSCSFQLSQLTLALASIYVRCVLLSKHH